MDRGARWATAHRVVKSWTRLKRLSMHTRMVHRRVSQVAPMVKNPPANAGDTRDMGLIPRSGRSPGGRNGNPLQYSCLEDPVDRGVWRATVLEVAKSRTGLKRQHGARHRQRRRCWPFPGPAGEPSSQLFTQPMRGPEREVTARRCLGHWKAGEAARRL